MSSGQALKHSPSENFSNEGYSPCAIGAPRGGGGGGSSGCESGAGNAHHARFGRHIRMSMLMTLKNQGAQAQSFVMLIGFSMLFHLSDE